MLRITKYIQSEIKKEKQKYENPEGSIQIYEVLFHRGDEGEAVLDTVDIPVIPVIQVSHYEWLDGDIPKPKNEKFHVPKKLAIWYKRYLEKRLDVQLDQAQLFYDGVSYIGWRVGEYMNTKFELIRKQQKNVYMHPIYNRGEYGELVEKIGEIGDKLKIDVCEAFDEHIK